MEKEPKDSAVVLVVHNLSKAEAGALVGEFAKAKNKVAPNARATGGITSKENVGRMLQAGVQKMIGKKAKPQLAEPKSKGKEKTRTDKPKKEKSK